jgi:hypothetical protein
MKKTIAVASLVLASVLIAQAETKTVTGTLERSKGGSHTFVLRDPSISVMENTVYTASNIQGEFEAYEGKQVSITGDFSVRPRGDTVIKSVDKIEVLGEETAE